MKKKSLKMMRQILSEMVGSKPEYGEPIKIKELRESGDISARSNQIKHFNEEELIELFDYMLGIEYTFDFWAILERHVDLYTPWNRSTMLELHDEHLFWEIDNENLPTDDSLVYWIGDFVNRKNSLIKDELGIDVYFEGRSGRHCCIELSGENLLYYDYLKEKALEYYNELVEMLNNYTPEEEQEDEKENIVTIKTTQKNWDVIMETLQMDLESDVISEDIKKELKEAIDNLEVNCE